MKLLHGGLAMIQGGHERLKMWVRKYANYRLARKQSDYRAVEKAKRIVFFDGMADSKFNGDPLAGR